jgi:hypothetical protein
MARKTEVFTVSEAGRDLGKVFFLREMPASQAEKWAARCFLGMAKSGLEIPDNIGSLGLAGIAAVGLRAIASISFDLAEPLLDEMFACVQIIPDPKRPQVMRALVEDDIEDVLTRLTLRKEIFGLHVDFSKAAAFLTSAPAAAPNLAAPAVA